MCYLAMELRRWNEPLFFFFLFSSELTTVLGLCWSDNWALCPVIVRSALWDSLGMYCISAGKAIIACFEIQWHPEQMLGAAWLPQILRNMWAVSWSCSAQTSHLRTACSAQWAAHHHQLEIFNNGLMPRKYNQTRTAAGLCWQFLQILLVSSSGFVRRQELSIGNCTLTFKFTCQKRVILLCQNRSMCNNH